MCIEILKTEIIPKQKYSNYTGIKIIDQARKMPGYTLLKVEFAYEGRRADSHILIESGTFREPPEIIRSQIKKILLDWIKENYYMKPIHDIKKNKITYH